MTRLARTERTALCDLALEVGPDAPTLSGDWTVRDLVAHLLVREGSPAAVGIAVTPLSPLTERATRRLARRDLADLVARLRKGPPPWSPFALPPVDAVANTLEFYVHHEDIRRARPGWEPRALSHRDEALLWRQVAVAGKGLVRAAPVGVVLERSDRGDRTVLRSAERSVTVRGLPGELVLFVYGRRQQARVELDGEPADLEALAATRLGI